MSIAVELVRQLEAVAAENGMVRVEAFGVTAGALRGIVPEALDLAFEAASVGTRAEGARIDLEIVQPRAHCRRCGMEFAIAIDSFLCPGCNHADAEMIVGNEIILTTVTGQGPEGDDGEDQRGQERAGGQ